MTKQNIILSFIRLNNDGSFEKITWTKNQDGSKICSREFVRPSKEDALKIAQSQFQEVILVPGSDLPGILDGIRQIAQS